EAVLAEAQALNLQIPAGDIVDWGCGTAIASRTFKRCHAPFGPEKCVTPFRVWLVDRSEVAGRFAEARWKEEFPEVVTRVTTEDPRPGEPFTLLVSHVLTEIAAEQMERLARLIQRAELVFWVE